QLRGQVEIVAHPVPLGAQVGDVVSGHRSGGADPPDEVKVVAGQPAVLVWVVGDQPQPADTSGSRARAVQVTRWLLDRRARTRSAMRRNGRPWASANARVCSPESGTPSSPTSSVMTPK